MVRLPLRGRHRKKRDIREKGTLMPLSEVLAGTGAVVVELRGRKGFVSRMASLGFTPGADLHVVQNYRHGPIIVLVRGARVALGREAASRVWVE
jgi:ferrous iron transport protein A